MNDQTITLDVRDDLRHRREPFTKIMSVASALRRGGSLLIIAPFQPVPLFSVLKKLGFSYTAKPTDSGDWQVLFTRQSEVAAPELAQPPQGPVSAALPRLLGRFQRSLKPAPSPHEEGGKVQHVEIARVAGQSQPDGKPDLKLAAVEVDARGLEPPQPMVKILEALADLPPGAELKARTDRRPMHLYAPLEERGFTAETTEQPDGSFLTYVRRD
jgi:uncharacterized protein (DUF2249 family)